MRKLGLLILALLWVTAPAMADSIGPDPIACPTCQGSIYTLEYIQTGSNATDSFFDVFFTIDTTGYNGGGTLLDAVAFKVSASSDQPTDVALLSAPNVALNWGIFPGGINMGADGCASNGGGWVCAQASALMYAAAVPDGIYTWEFSFTLPNGAIFLDPFAASIKALYVDNDGDKVGALVSENITLQERVPEPGTLLLFGSALLGLARTIRKRLPH